MWWIPQKVFPEIPIFDFKNNKNLKSHLVRTGLPDVKEVGRCKPCGGKRPLCQLRSNMKNTSTFKSNHSNKVYQIKKNFNGNSEMVVYLIDIVFAESIAMVVPWQNFVLEPITIKVHIVIFRKNKSCQTKPVTRNVFTNVISRVAITGFVTGKSQ